MRNVRALSVFLRWNRQQAAIVSGAGQGTGTVVHPHQIEAPGRRCLTYSNNRKISWMYVLSSVSGPDPGSVAF